MKTRSVIWLLGTILAVLPLGPGAWPCTSILVTGGASEDGSVILTYNCDGEFHPRLRYLPAQDHEEGSFHEIRDWSGELKGRIKQVPHTYGVVGLMNEHQLAIGETTFDGRTELENPEGLLHYWTLMQLALQRAKTAREAIQVITGLVDEYGYRSTGESISIADKEEAWLLEIIGPGPKGKGALWVAVRIPDGYVSCTANRARIGTFPLDDPENCLYADNVISFAVEKGYHDPDAGVPFSFCDVYCPATPQQLRYTEARVWSIFRRCAPSREFSVDYHRGVKGAERYPLWIKPDEKLSVADVFALMRDHYEGTPYDMTNGVDAGPFGSPNRWRPMTFEAGGAEHSWERPISTQQTGFSHVTQSRGWLPDAVGGVYWYGVDDTYTSCYMPLYCGITAVPESYTVGSLQKFSWDSAWWTFNFTANFANLKYSYMVEDILKVQAELEGNFFQLQPAVERTALALSKTNPDLMIRYLTDYSVSHAEMVKERWRRLGEHLITRYNDGYVQDENGRPREVGYPEAWLEEVLKSRPDQFTLTKWGGETTDKELP